MGGDDTPDNHLAASSAALDRLDTELYSAVVDQHVVADLEDRAEDGGADRQVAGMRCVFTRDNHGGAPLELDGRVEIADAELWPL